MLLRSFGVFRELDFLCLQLQVLAFLLLSPIPASLHGLSWSLSALGPTLILCGVLFVHASSSELPPLYKFLLIFKASLSLPFFWQPHVPPVALSKGLRVWCSQHGNMLP